MTQKQYGEWLATIMSAPTGGIGMYGVMRGLWDLDFVRAGIGLVFVGLGMFLYSLIKNGRRENGTRPD